MFSATMTAPVIGLLGLLGLVSTPAAALPAPVAARDANAGCTAHSFNDFHWTITDFVYNASIVFSTPAHQIDNGLVQFNLTNPALDYAAECKAWSSRPYNFFYGDIIYNCTVPAEHADSTQTTFSFNEPSFTVSVNQTWSCDDTDSRYPDTFTYAGAINITTPPLDCTYSNYVNPNWTMGQIYSINSTACTAGEISVSPYLCMAIA